MASLVEDIIKGIIDYAKSETGKAVIKTGVTTAVVVGATSSAITYVATKKEDEKIIKEEKKASFQAGIYKGLEISEEQIKLNILAQISVLYFIAWADGEIQKEEKEMIDNVINQITKNVVIDGLDRSLKVISENKKIDMTFVKIYLDTISDELLKNIIQDIYVIAEINDGICESERKRIQELEEYTANRLKNSKPQNYVNGVSVGKVQEEVDLYEKKMNKLDELYTKRLQLNKKEISLLSVAIALQSFRIYCISEWTKIEKANSGKREEKLHEKQKEILEKMNDSSDVVAHDYYAPLQQIITTSGVPYDITRMAGPKADIFNASAKGKGANHRFSTLGHDPIIGLLVGTTNIMTNTITTTREDKPFPITYHVKYDESYKNGKIYCVPPASFIDAMNSVVTRTEEDIKPLVSALLKQIIHIATDLYTPTGIQLPGANLVLTRENAEVLTSYISSGDVIKFGVSKGIEAIIDTIIVFLHGCIILETGGDLANEINRAKAKKIILYSKGIVQSSNILMSALTLDLQHIDWAGFSTLFSRFFSDVKFIYDLKHEFIRNGLDEQYNPCTRKDFYVEDVILMTLVENDTWMKTTSIKMDNILLEHTSMDSIQKALNNLTKANKIEKLQENDEIKYKIAAY